MNKRMIAPSIEHKAQVLTLILSESQSHKCTHLIKEKGVFGGMVIIGRGTVNNAVLNMLGIKSGKKEVINLLMKSERAKELLDYLDRELQLEKPGRGIAFTTPVINEIGLSNGEEKGSKETVTNTQQYTEGESMFKKLTVIVDRGLSEDVMDIARKAGVRGGTILHGRGTSSEIATKLFGVEILPEKELVMIPTPNNLVDKVIKALAEGLHLDKPGKGILYVEPILETRGLLEMSENN
jgi:nitrogen regulatory protein PII